MLVEFPKVLQDDEIGWRDRERERAGFNDECSALVP